MTTIDTTPDRAAARRIAGEVRAEMSRQRKSQRDLAEQLGWPQPRLSRRLTGDVDMRVGELEAIATALGSPVTQFLVTAA